MTLVRCADSPRKFVEIILKKNTCLGPKKWDKPPHFSKFVNLNFCYKNKTKQ